MEHPYVQREGTREWQVIWKAIDDLVANNDLRELTQREYIVGLILERLAAADALRG